MYIYKLKKQKVRKYKCNVVKQTSYYVNGTLVEAKVTYECKPKVKKCNCRRQRAVGEVLCSLWY